ncbi:hypothetical protein GCM10027048_30830 [Hymenobacter coalescens]
MLELLLIALIQMNTLFGTEVMTESADETTPPPPTTTTYTGGNGWGDTHK